MNTKNVFVVNQGFVNYVTLSRGWLKIFNILFFNFYFFCKKIVKTTENKTPGLIKFSRSKKSLIYIINKVCLLLLLLDA